jgi:aspartyl-tRNA(Asn)/glutamyl-tRNA(Gln) amidotransferase subunit B
MDYELVAGIETHVQLGTRTKLFCGCPVKFGAPPNTLVCPVCLGHPGALPVLNRAAFDRALRAALALDCTIAPFTKFDRKNYYYPDLPKNYQISQYDLPFSRDGRLDIGDGREVRILRVHLEEDAGKLIHEENGGRSFVDLNRTGVPLVEIVTHPDLRSADEAWRYMTALKEILQYAGVSDCDMEKGELRCDVNLSIRPRGEEKLGVKTEIKNVNSFRFAKAAIEFEFGRQVRVLQSGERVVQETRLWDADKGVTRPMRSKEEAHDYRYFPEPDLPPVRVDREWIDRVKAEIPELPGAKRARLAREYGLGEADARVLVADRASADFFEQAAKLSGKPRAAANWVVNDLHKVLHERGIPLEAAKITPAGLAELIALVESGTLTGASARAAFAEMVSTGRPAGEIVREKGMARVADEGAIEAAARAAIEASPRAAADFRAGKDAALKALLGGVMKQTRGRADPRKAEEALRRLLGR